MSRQLEFSRGRRLECDLETIRCMLTGCVDVRIATPAEDRSGVDYVATLRRGADVRIDAKARSKGCRGFWRHGPDLALEKWSVIPTDSDPDGRCGWTLSESSDVDLILFTFDPSDCKDVYLIPFQPLRLAFRHNLPDWERCYKVKRQRTEESGRAWQSQCVFVPACVVEDAVRRACRGRLSDPFAVPDGGSRQTLIGFDGDIEF